MKFSWNTRLNFLSLIHIAFNRWTDRWNIIKNMSGTNFVSRNNPFQGLLCVRLIIFYFDFPMAFVTFPSTLRDWLLLFERKVTIILIEKIISSTVFIPLLRGILFISKILFIKENLIYFEYLKKILYFIYKENLG